MKFFFSCSIRHLITRSLRSSWAIELSTRREIPCLPGSGSPPSPVKRHQVEPKFCKTLVNLWCCGAFHCGIYEQHHVVYIFSSCLVSFRFLFFFQTCIDDENNFSIPLSFRFQKSSIRIQTQSFPRKNRMVTFHSLSESLVSLISFISSMVKLIHRRTIWAISHDSTISQDVHQECMTNTSEQF